MDICSTYVWAQLISLSCHKQPFLVCEMEFKNLFSYVSLGKSTYSLLVDRKKNCNGEEKKNSKLTKLVCLEKPERLW